MTASSPTPRAALGAKACARSSAHAGAPSPRRQRGATLIEVLISMVVLSLGVMGMAATQGRAVQYASSAEDRNRAALMADELVSQMWMAGTTSLPTATRTAWNTRLSNMAVSGLPNATGTIGTPSTDANGVTSVTITISWRPPSVNSSAGNYSYATKVSIP